MIARSRVALVALVALAACEPRQAGEPDAAPADGAGPAIVSEVPAVGESADVPGASEAASAHAARWEEARNSALRIPCRAIAVDGPVRTEGPGGAGTALDAGGAANAGAALDAGGALALEGEIPNGEWLSVARDGRLVAKDPRTTRETSFVGPARVRACVGHREESWLTMGRFESAIGAGETPGAEEWVVTPHGVVRYMAAKLAVDVRPRDADVAIGSGVAFLWLPDDVHEGGPARPHAAGTGDPSAPRAGDASAPASTALDDDGWRRLSEGVLTLTATARSPVEAARSTVDRCVALTARARELAIALLAGPATSPDGGSTAKVQMQTRLLARASCTVAELRVDSLPSSGPLSAPKGEMSARLDAARPDAASRP